MLKTDRCSQVPHSVVKLAYKQRNNGDRYTSVEETLLKTLLYHLQNFL